jgi:hypothetical protein
MDRGLRALEGWAGSGFGDLRLGMCQSVVMITIVMPIMLIKISA